MKNNGMYKIRIAAAKQAIEAFKTVKTARAFEAAVVAISRMGMPRPVAVKYLCEKVAYARTFA